MIQVERKLKVEFRVRRPTQPVVDVVVHVSSVAAILCAAGVESVQHIDGDCVCPRPSARGASVHTKCKCVVQLRGYGLVVGNLKIPVLAGAVESAVLESEIADALILACLA